MSVIFENVSVGYRRHDVLKNISFEAKSGEITAIAGRNGAGKSTLLGALTGAKRELSGRIIVDNHDLLSFSPNERARFVAPLGQSLPHPHVTVRELAEFGRTPHLPLGGRLSAEDRAAVERALELAGVSDLAERFADSLSGGEHRRAFFAMTLAQDAPVLVLDEPTTHLDAAARFELIELIERCRDDGRTVIVVLHELPEMLSCANKIVLLDGGSVAFCGHSEQFLAENIDRKYFDVVVRGDREHGYSVTKA